MSEEIKIKKPRVVRAKAAASSTTSPKKRKVAAPRKKATKATVEVAGAPNNFEDPMVVQMAVAGTMALPMEEMEPVEPEVVVDDSMLIEQYKFIDVRVVPSGRQVFMRFLKICLSLVLLILPGLFLLVSSFWDFGSPFEAIFGIVFILLGLKVFIRNILKFFR